MVLSIYHLLENAKAEMQRKLAPNLSSRNAATTAFMLPQIFAKSIKALIKFATKH